MNIKLYVTCLVSVMVLTNHLKAQTTTTVHEANKGTVNFTEMANYEKRHPVALKRKPPMKEVDEDMERIVNPPADPALVHMMPGAGSGYAERTYHAYLPVSASPADTFEALVTDGTTIPPDTHGAVDSTYAVSALNSKITIQRRSNHTAVSSVSLNSFWGSSLIAGGSPYDPRVHYDPYAKRWIIVYFSVLQGTTSFSASRILIAMSATGDPTGTWYKFAIVTDATNATWLDFPVVGFNKKWVTVSGNYFSSPVASSAYTNSVIYAFDKTLLMAGTSATATRIALSASGGFTVCPAITYDSVEPSMFLVDAYNGGSGQLRLRKLTGTSSAAVLSATIGYPTSSVHWGYQGNGGSDFAPQLGTTNKLQTNDDRINNVTFRNGKVWCAHNIFLPSSSPTRCSAMWWQIDTNATVAQNDTVDDPTSAQFYTFPSLSVNENNDALIGFTVTSAAMHPSCGYRLHMNSDGNNTMRPLYIYRHGLTSYYQTFGGSDNRWGDYSGTCVDPRNDLDFWTIQETTPSGSANRWDTWWAYVKVCPTRPAPVLTISPSSQCIGDSALYAVASDTGSSSFTWTLTTATGWSTFGSTTDSIYLTAGTGAATVTVEGNNVCGAGAVLTFSVAPTIIPPLPVINTLTPVCLGTPPTAIFSASPAGATTYNWQVYGTGWGNTSMTDSFTAIVGTDTGTVIVSETNACGTGPNDTIKVMPGTPPGADTNIVSPAILCSGSHDVFTTTAVSGATSYTWSVSGTGWSGSSSTASLSATVGTGAGTITVTPVNQCGTGTPFTLTTTVPAVTPSATFTIAAHATRINTADVITIGTVITGATYTWNFDGGTAVPGGSGPGPQTVHWTTAGTYTVTVTVNNGGCTATYSDTVHVSTGVGVEEVTLSEMNAVIVPNP